MKCFWYKIHYLILTIRKLSLSFKQFNFMKFFYYFSHATIFYAKEVYQKKLLVKKAQYRRPVLNPDMKWMAIQKSYYLQ